MPEDTVAFQNLIAQVRQGNAEAAKQLYETFVGRLIRLARQKLPADVQVKLDPEDVVQSAMRSFFGHLQAGEYELRNRDALWSLLALITLRKCGHKIKFYLAACRDLRKEVRAHETLDENSCAEPAVFQALAREPNPAEQAQLIESVQLLMQRLNRKQRRIVMLRLQGYSTAEIARQLGKSQRSVQLVLETAYEILLALLAAERSDEDAARCR